MSAVIKGTSAVQLVRQEYRYDPQIDGTVLESEYHGSTKSALGFFGRSKGAGNNVSVSLDNGTGRVVIQRPVGTAKEENQYTERYEVAIEFLEKEIWQNTEIAQEARRYNALIDSSASAEDMYYREACEEIATKKLKFTINPIDYPLAEKVIRYLRDGVTGWETEYVVVKRSRRIPREQSLVNTSIATVGEGKYIYTTAQLGLPDDIAFSVPDSSSLTPISSDYVWGWRRRPSTSTIEGMFIDQNSEFILSQWSTLFYTVSQDNASW